MYPEYSCQLEDSKMWVEDAGRCLVVAEVGQAHDGSLGAAHAYIDVVADAGVDAVKFQTHIAGRRARSSEPWRRFSPRTSRRYDYCRGAWSSRNPQWVTALKDHAERGLQFLSSPFSTRGRRSAGPRRTCRCLEDRVGRGGTGATWRRMAAPGRKIPVLLSSGMSSWDGARTRQCRSGRAGGATCGGAAVHHGYPIRRIRWASTSSLSSRSVSAAGGPVGPLGHHLHPALGNGRSGRA